MRACGSPIAHPYSFPFQQTDWRMSMSQFNVSARRFVSISVLVVAACLVVPIASQGSTITWSAPQNITGDANVDTTGSLIAAFNVGGPGVGSITVNGVTFNAFALSGATSTVGNFTFAIPTSFARKNAVGSAFNTFANLSASYETLLSSAAGDVTMPFTLPVSGVTSW